jgi:hypothetical protein
MVAAATPRLRHVVGPPEPVAPFVFVFFFCVSLLLLRRMLAAVAISMLCLQHPCCGLRWSPDPRWFSGI